MHNTILVQKSPLPLHPCTLLLLASLLKQLEGHLQNLQSTGTLGPFATCRSPWVHATDEWSEVFVSGPCQARAGVLCN